MATYTAGDQINAALRKLGILAEGETPSAETSADALMALNQMLDSWSTERLTAYSTMTQTFTWPANTQILTFGPSGTITGTRPIGVDDSTYYSYQNLDYDLSIINQDQYNSIALKSTTSSLPECLFVNSGYPNTELSLYPVPIGDLSFHLVSVTPLDQPALLTTTLAFPPGYLRAFAYNLAIEVAPEFGVEASDTVKKIAIASKRYIKRINNPEDVMSIPSTLLPNPGGFNYYTGAPW